MHFKHTPKKLLTLDYPGSKILGAVAEISLTERILDFVFCINIYVGLITNTNCYYCLSE